MSNQLRATMWLLFFDVLTHSPFFGQHSDGMKLPASHVSLSSLLPPWSSYPFLIWTSCSTDLPTRQQQELPCKIQVRAHQSFAQKPQSF